MAPSIVLISTACASAWIYTYGLCLLSIDVLLSSFPLPLIGSVILLICVYIVRLPPPPQELVDEVLGKDLFIETDDDTLDALNKPESEYHMKVAAHRGAGFDAPENSISAFRKAKERGCTAVEFDVAMTSDGVAVLFHDNTLNRMCESEGIVSEMTWAQLQEMDISKTHPLNTHLQQERIPELEEAVQECLRLGLRMFIDLKDTNTRVVPVIIELFRKFPELTRSAVVTTFFPHLIFMIRRSCPEVVCSLAWRPSFLSYEDYSYSRSLGGPYRRRYPSLWQHALACVADRLLEWSIYNLLYFVLGLAAVLVHKDSLSPEVVRQWRKKGVRAIAWPVNIPEEKAFFSKVLQVTYMTDTMDGEY